MTHLVQVCLYFIKDYFNLYYDDGITSILVAQGLCRAERLRFEPRSVRDFLTERLPYTVLYEFIPLSRSISLRIETGRVRKERIAQFQNNNDK